MSKWYVFFEFLMTKYYVTCQTIKHYLYMKR